MSSTVQQTGSDYLPSEYFSGGLSISGLTGNGTDFNGMIDQLRKIEMIPTQRMLRWKADWRARQEAFGQVRTSLVNLRDICNKMSTMDKFLVKKASSSQPNFATATASSTAVSNSYKLEINQVATTSIWSLNKEFPANTALVNPSNATSNATFGYEYNGTTRSLTIPPGTSLEQLKNMINNDASNPGVRASIIKTANGVTFQIKGMDQGEKHDLTITSTSGLAGFPDNAKYPAHHLAYNTSITDPDDANQKVTGSEPQVFSYSYNGVKKDVIIPANATLRQFIDAINADLPAGMDPVDKELNTFTGAYDLKFTGTLNGASFVVPKGGKFEALGQPTTINATDPDPDSWHVQHSQNAQIKVDGWPSTGWLEVPNNTVDDVVEGVTFTLIGEGVTTVSVTTDSEAVQENVVEFIEAINEFRTTIHELTKYDANKSTVDLNYAESLYEMQKGSILTGNYGVQLISSRIKQATAGMPKGFMPRSQQGDLFFGDLYTSLSQIGIKTNAEGSGGENFGLLELNTDPKLPLLDDILQKNPEAVAEFFAAVNKGVSDSSDFSFDSSMQSITRPGAYEVTYKLVDDGSGKPTVVDAYINGKKAEYNPVKQQIGLARKDPSSTDKNVATALTQGEIDFEAKVTVEQLAITASQKISTDLTNTTDAITSTDGNFHYTYDGQDYYVGLGGGDSLGMLAAKINYAPNNPGVRAELEMDNGKYSLVLKSKQGGAGPAVGVPANAMDFTVAAGANPVVETAVAGRDGKYKIEYETPPGSGSVKTVEVNNAKSNKVTVAGLPGVEFTLKKEDGPVTIAGSKHNDADGLYLQIDNLTISNTPYTGQARIKQGKINEILEMLNGTASKPEEGILGSKGTLQVLVDNYDKIIEGIDGKIERETARLIKWERTQKLRFSRLEATLKQYESLQASIESQVKQLSGNSK